MRRATLAAILADMTRTPVLLAFVLPAALYACVDDTVAPSTGPADAGLPVADASFPDVAAPTADAAIADAGADATDASGDAGLDAPDGASPGVTVVITQLETNAPVAGVMVVFQDASGTVTGTATTDASGAASRVVAAGTQVTALFQTATSRSAVTVVGVQPGDVVHLADIAPPSFATVASITVTPPTSPVGTAQLTTQAGTCKASVASGSATLSLYSGFYPSCIALGTFPLLVTAFGASAAPLGFAFQKPNALPAGGGAAIVVPGPFTALGSETILASNAPDGGGPVFTQLTEVADGVPLVQSGAADTSDGGAPSSVYATHPGYADFVQNEVHTSTTLPSNAGTNWQGVATRSAPGAATATVDLGQVLPQVTSGVITEAEANRPQVDWQTSAPLTSAGGVVLAFSWPTTIDGGSVNAGWTLIVPPDGPGSVKVPHLPASASEWLPLTNAISLSGPVIMLVKGAPFPSYDVARARLQAFRALTPWSFTSGIPLLTADGTLAVTSFQKP